MATSVISATGTITISRTGGDVDVDGDIPLATGLLLLADGNDAAVGGTYDSYFVQLEDSRLGTGLALDIRVTIDRYAVRNGIARNYQRVSRRLALANGENGAVGTFFYIPDGEISVLSITVAGTAAADAV